MTPQQLVAHWPIISEQVNRDQLCSILCELDTVLSRGVSGAVVEFGCYLGTTSLFIRRLLDERHDTRPFHVYDSFEGLPPKTSRDFSAAGEQFQAGELRVSKRQLLRKFQKAGLRPPVVHKAWFRDLVSADIPEHIAFAFLDGDFYESIRDSLTLVLPRLAQGGIIVVDDYTREALPGVARALGEFFPPGRVHISHNLGIIRL